MAPEFVDEGPAQWAMAVGARGTSTDTAWHATTTEGCIRKYSNNDDNKRRWSLTLFQCKYRSGFLNRLSKHPVAGYGSFSGQRPHAYMEHSDISGATRQRIPIRKPDRCCTAQLRVATGAIPLVGTITKLGGYCMPGNLRVLPHCPASGERPTTPAAPEVTPFVGLRLVCCKLHSHHYAEANLTPDVHIAHRPSGSPRA